VGAVRHDRRAAQTVYEWHDHLVVTTTYRKPVGRGEVAVGVGELIREICRTLDMEILVGHAGRTTCTCCCACRRT
jgi:putative transposase